MKATSGRNTIPFPENFFHAVPTRSTLAVGKISHASNLIVPRLAGIDINTGSWERRRLTGTRATEFETIVPITLYPNPYDPPT
jgi:hypothetical protein